MISPPQDLQLQPFQDLFYIYTRLLLHLQIGLPVLPSSHQLVRHSHIIYATEINKVQNILSVTKFDYRKDFLSHIYIYIYIYIYTFFFFLLNSSQWAMASSFTRFLDHTQWLTTVGRTPLDEWSAWRRDLYLTTHDTHNRQTSMPPVGFEPTISEGKRP